MTKWEIMLFYEPREIAPCQPKEITSSQTPLIPESRLRMLPQILGLSAFGNDYDSDVQVHIIFILVVDYNNWKASEEHKEVPQGPGLLSSVSVPFLMFRGKLGNTTKTSKHIFHSFPFHIRFTSCLKKKITMAISCCMQGGSNTRRD